MGEEDDERRTLFVKNGAEGKVDLRKTGCTALTVECMGETHIYGIDYEIKGGEA
jgi:hypothetical protein